MNFEPQFGIDFNNHRYLMIRFPHNYHPQQVTKTIKGYCNQKLKVPFKLLSDNEIDLLLDQAEAEWHSSIIKSNRHHRKFSSTTTTWEILPRFIVEFDGYTRSIEIRVRETAIKMPDYML